MNRNYFDAYFSTKIILSVLLIGFTTYLIKKIYNIFFFKLNFTTFTHTNGTTVEYALIENKKSLNFLINEIYSENITKIGLDTEYHKGYKYKGHLCLFQISFILNNKKKIYIIDLLKFEKKFIKEKFQKILTEDKIEKILHASENDCEWIYEDYGIFLKNIFDTQEIYMNLTDSNKKMGLNYLLNKYFEFNMGKDTKKFFQTSDWNKRPLLKDQLNYAALDTFYLVDIREILYEEMKEKINKEKSGKNVKINKEMENNKDILEENIFSDVENFITTHKNKIHEKLERRLINSDRSKRNEEKAINYLLSNLVKCEKMKTDSLQKFFLKIFNFNENYCLKNNLNPEEILSMKTIFRLATSQPENFETFNKILIKDNNSKLTDKITIKLLSTNEEENEKLKQEYKQNLFQIIENFIKKENEDNNNPQNSNRLLSDKDSIFLASNVTEKTHFYNSSNKTTSKPTKEIKKQEKMESIIKKFSCKKPVYENCVMLAPDGEMLAFCDNKKMSWYLERNLADVINSDPPTFKLRFEPNLRGCIDQGNIQSDFYVKDRKNCCVVCGHDKNYMRFHIVPVIYRTYLPNNLKSHKSHDVLLLCFNCHEKANTVFDLKKLELAEEYNCPLNSLSDDQKEIKIIQKIVKFAEILKNKNFNIPQERKENMAEEVLDFIKKNKENSVHQDFFEKIFSENLNLEEKNMKFPMNIEDLTIDIYEKMSKYDVKNYLPGEKKNFHGKSVIDQITNYEEFIKLWREYFLKTMQPKYLPSSWNVLHQFNRKFGEFSKFNQEW